LYCLRYLLLDFAIYTVPNLIIDNVMNMRHGNIKFMR
jgi:hypothetical protein